MELSVTQENLSRALSNVGRVASSRTQLPIMNNILLRTDGSRLLIAAMNMEIASTQHIGAKIIKPGAITIPARLVSDFVASIPKGAVELKVERNHLHITSGSYTSKINGLSADDFPELPSVDDKTAVQYVLSAQDFKHAASQTVITTSNDATRPVLTGVYWHTHEGSIYLAGTDGYRLAERKLVETKSDIAAIIPTTSLQEVLRTFNDDTKEVSVLFDESQVSFSINDSVITSQLIDGNFPDYRQLIPSSSQTNFTIARDEFTRITKVASLFARDSGGSVKIDVNAEDKTVSLQSIASELGENMSTVEVDAKGESATVTLNSRYLIEALSVIEGKEVRFSFSGKLAPCLLTSTDKQSNYQHIIMPLKS